MFGDEWTPAHLAGGPTNLYKEIALALKGVEWRQPGLVAVAAKLAGSAAPHKPIEIKVPESYERKTGPNPWAGIMTARQALLSPRMEEEPLTNVALHSNPNTIVVETLKPDVTA